MSAIDCDTMRDRMPEVARGSATWAAAEAAHLADCAECRAEWAVVSSAVTLGARVEAEFDAAGTARKVVTRLRHRAPAQWPARRYLVGLAAAAALVLVVSRPGLRTPAATSTEEARFLPELDSLTADELTVIAEGFEAPLTETTIIEGQPLFELDSTQLERVLRSLEG